MMHLSSTCLNHYGRQVSLVSCQDIYLLHEHINKYPPLSHGSLINIINKSW